VSVLAVRGTDRLNPVLVKEVRAAMRARVFRMVFQIVLLGTVLVAVLALANLNVESDKAGQSFFFPIYFCLCIALLGVIPMSAFFALGSEWEENAYDLLAISSLRPVQIVFGKLWTSAVAALLYFSAFAPVLVLAFLMRGIDIGVLLIVLAVTFCASIGAAGAAIGLSSLSRSRPARVLLLVVTAGLAIGLIALDMDRVVTLIDRPWVFRGATAGDLVSTVLATSLGAGALGITLACERLAHPEENHSTGPRVTVTALYALYLSWLALRMSASSYATGAAVGLTFVALAHVFFVTENETLARRVQRQVPRSGGLALLATPFFPGGGRAIFLFGVNVLLAILFGLLSEAQRHGPFFEPPAWLFQHAYAFLLFCGYLFIYLAGFSLPFVRPRPEPRVRWVARVGVPLVALLTVFAPAIVDFLSAKHQFVEMRHPLNPFWVLWPDTSDVTLSRISVVMVPLVVVVGLANLMRLDKAWRELQKHSRENRERAAA
jgi:hypothetical protein